MPDPIDPVKAFEKRIVPYQGGEHRVKNPLGIVRYKEIFTNHPNPADKQLEFDVALWYADLMTTLDVEWKNLLVRRVFTLLAFGGLMVDKGANAETHDWQPWALDQIPICSAISHTARVMVWLPPGNGAAELWNWLWAGHAPQRRGFATHGVEAVPTSEIYPEVNKGCKENKSKNPCNHYFLNLVLGGLGNINPVSGNLIEDTGQHGHLYLAFSKRRINNRSVLLISTEQSAPADCETNANGRRLYNNKLTQFRRASKGVPDQYGGKHGLGGHSRFSATGGDDFGYKDKPSALTDAGYGPTRGHYLDGMFIDLTGPRFNFIKTIDFQPHHVALTGIPPVDGIPPAPRQRPRTVTRLPFQQISIAPRTTGKFFIRKNKISVFLIICIWLFGNGITDSALLCLCCHEYKKNNPTKRKASFIFHTFLRRKMNSRRNLTDIGEYDPALLSVNDDGKNIVEKLFLKFQTYVFFIKNPSHLSAPLLNWWGAMSDLNKKTPANLFDKVLETTETALSNTLGSFEMDAMVENAKATARDMKTMRGGRTQHAKGEKLGYENKHKRYKALVQLLEASGFEKTPAFLKEALKQTKF